MLKLKCKQDKNDNVKVDIKGKDFTLAEYLSAIFTCMDEITERFDKFNRGKLLDILNKHYEYYDKERTM